jgi:hypothetical protein
MIEDSNFFGEFFTLEDICDYLKAQQYPKQGWVEYYREKIASIVLCVGVAIALAMMPYVITFYINWLFK